MAWEPAIRFTQEFMGPERVLYAMDYPYQYAVDEVIALDAMTISDAHKRMFFQTNAQTVFKIARALSRHASRQNSSKRRRHSCKDPWTKITASLLLGASTVLAQAQTWPTQTIRIVVPFTPGTGMDTIARTVAPRLSERLGQPVLVQNTPGASGNIGADNVAKAAPDGYTVLMGANTMLMASQLYKNVPFDPIKDFAPVSLAAWGTLMLVANPKTGIHSMADLITRSKAKPGSVYPTLSAASPSEKIRFEAPSPPLLVQRRTQTRTNLAAPPLSLKRHKGEAYCFDSILLALHTSAPAVSLPL